MPNYQDLYKEIIKYPKPLDRVALLRKGYLTRISRIRKRNTIAYYSNWLNGEVPYIGIDELDKHGFMCTLKGLDRSMGLDLILHTPGGDLAAMEGIVEYLQDAFKGDIAAIVPQISMSAGTMIALLCKEIIMGRQSVLGPIDPQMGIDCQSALSEFNRAKKEVKENPSSLGL